MLEATRQRIRSKFAATNTTVDVQTPFGGVRGFITDSNKSQHFLGIPFAEPPIGDLRWQPPTGPKSWNGTIDADWFGDSCPQSSGVMTLGTAVSEDCLYLNVYRPNKPAPAGGFPVMVFIYGGSWEEGSDGFLLYWADNDIALVEDVIVVTINYRLSAFGFLASETLRSQDPEGTTGNYGFQDQRAALKWAIQAAPSFGGNPQNVMLFGESAGAASTSCHLVSERSAGLFQRAAMESGPFAVWAAMPLNISEAKYARLAEYLGCTSGSVDLMNREEVLAIGSDDAVLTCLKSKNTSEILEAGHHTSQGVVSVDWAPTVDGVELTDLPENLAAAGKIHDVPTLLGTNMDEGTEFSKAPHDLNATGYLPYLEQRFSKSIADQVSPLYPPGDYQSPWWAETHIIGDGLMSCPARRSSRWMANMEGRKNPVFLYFYQHVLDVVQLFVPFKGCFHGSELVMVFDFDLALWTDEEKALAQNMVRYWTRFAVTGNPNGGTDVQWPAYDEAQDEVLVLDVGTLKTQSNLKKEVCDVWDTFYIDPSLVFGT
jgi:para-nitrobenzyl esterase